MTVVMDTIIKLNNQTAGRDKIVRLLQYGSRACWYYVQNGDSTRHSIDILKSLEYTFSSFRKLLRFGRFLDTLYSAISIMKYPDSVVRITLTLSKIANALFLLADHIIWLGRAGIMQVNVDKWNSVANKYWLMMIILNLTRDIYEIINIIEHESMCLKPIQSSRYGLLRQCQMLLHIKDHKDVFVDTIKNGCDLFIPLTALGFTRLSPGTVGMLGFISSVAALYSLTHPLAKLAPS